MGNRGSRESSSGVTPKINKDQKNGNDKDKDLPEVVLEVWPGSATGKRWKWKKFEVGRGMLMQYSAKKAGSFQESWVLSRSQVYMSADSKAFSETLKKLGLPQYLKDEPALCIVAEAPGLRCVVIRASQAKSKSLMANPSYTAKRIKAVEDFVEKIAAEMETAKQEIVATAAGQLQDDIKGKSKLQALEMIIDHDIKAIANPRLKRLANALTTKVMGKSEIQNEQERMVMEVAERLTLKIAEATVALRHFGWDKSALYRSWREDPQEARKQAGMMVAEVSPELELGDQDPNKMVLCPICYDDVKAKDTFSLACKHAVCNECWGRYLEDKVKTGKACVMALCMYHKCRCRVPKEVFHKFLSAESVEKYDKYAADDFVEANKKLIWCPAAGCGRALGVPQEGDPPDMHCLCGYSFCRLCSKDAHGPLPCKFVDAWESMVMDSDQLSAAEKAAKKREKELKQRMRKEAEQNEKWLLKRAKPCPKCLKWIEKNQGCNHMTCKPQAGGCGHQFCWLCLGNWAGHRSCATVNAQAKQKEVLERKRKEGYWDALTIKTFSSEEEERLALYSERYFEAMQAMGHLEKAKSSLEQVIRKSVSNFTRGDKQFFDEAVKRVLLCRRTLAWSYATANFMVPSAPMRLLNRQQAILERYTEALHELVEAPLKVLNYMSKKNMDSFRTFQSRILQVQLKATAAERALVTAVQDFADSGIIIGKSSMLFGTPSHPEHQVTQFEMDVVEHEIKSKLEFSSKALSSPQTPASLIPSERMWWEEIKELNALISSTDAAVEGKRKFDDEKDAKNGDDGPDLTALVKPSLNRQTTSVTPVVSVGGDAIDGSIGGDASTEASDELKVPAKLPTLRRQASAMWACVLCSHLNNLHEARCARCGCNCDGFFLGDSSNPNVFAKSSAMIDTLKRVDDEDLFKKVLEENDREEKKLPPGEPPVTIFIVDYGRSQLMALTEEPLPEKYGNDDAELLRRKLKKEKARPKGESKKQENKRPANRSKIERVELLGTYSAAESGLDLRNPGGCSLDAKKGEIVVADSNKHRVLVVNMNTSEVIAIIGTNNMAGASNTQLSCPYFATMDDENLYISDYNNRRIQVFDRDGYTFKRTIRSGGNRTNPAGLCVDAKHLYVCFPSNGAVSKYDKKSGACVAALGTSGVGSSTNNMLNNPWDICCDDKHLFIADRYNNRVAIWSKSNLRAVSEIRSGNNNQQISCPQALTILDDILFVVQSNRPIAMFDRKTYKHIGDLTTGATPIPTSYGIAAAKLWMNQSSFADSKQSLIEDKKRKEKLQGMFVDPKPGSVMKRATGDTITFLWDSGTKQAGDTASIFLTPHQTRAAALSLLQGDDKLVVARRVPNTGVYRWRVPSDEFFEALFVCGEDLKTAAKFKSVVEIYRADPKDKELMEILSHIHGADSKQNLRQALAMLSALTPRVSQAQMRVRVLPVLLRHHSARPELWKDAKTLRPLAQLARRMGASRQRGESKTTAMEEPNPISEGKTGGMLVVCDEGNGDSLNGLGEPFGPKDVVGLELVSCNGGVPNAQKGPRNVLVRHGRMPYIARRGADVNLTFKLPRRMRLEEIEILSEATAGETDGNPVGEAAVFVSLEKPAPNAYAEWNGLTKPRFDELAKAAQEKASLIVDGSRIKYSNLMPELERMRRAKDSEALRRFAAAKEREEEEKRRGRLEAKMSAAAPKSKESVFQLKDMIFDLEGGVQPSQRRYSQNRKRTSACRVLSNGSWSLIRAVAKDGGSPLAHLKLPSQTKAKIRFAFRLDCYCIGQMEFGFVLNAAIKNMIRNSGQGYAYQQRSKNDSLMREGDIMQVQIDLKLNRAEFTRRRAGTKPVLLHSETGLKLNNVKGIFPAFSSTYVGTKVSLVDPDTQPGSGTTSIARCAEDTAAKTAQMTSRVKQALIENHCLRGNTEQEAKRSHMPIEFIMFSAFPPRRLSLGPGGKVLSRDREQTLLAESKGYFAFEKSGLTNSTSCFIDHVNRRVYLCHRNTGKITIVDIATEKILQTLPNLGLCEHCCLIPGALVVSSSNVQSLKFFPDKNEYAEPNEGKTPKFKSFPRSPVFEHRMGMQPTGLCYDKDTNTLFCAYNANQLIMAFDLNELDLSKPSSGMPTRHAIWGGSNPAYFTNCRSIACDETTLYACGSGSNTLIAFNKHTLQFKSKIPLPRGFTHPKHISIASPMNTPGMPTQSAMMLLTANNGRGAIIPISRPSRGLCFDCEWEGMAAATLLPNTGMLEVQATNRAIGGSIDESIVKYLGLGADEDSSDTTTGRSGGGDAIFVAGYGSHRVTVVDNSNGSPGSRKTLTSVAIPPDSRGPQRSANINQPAGIAADEEHVYITEYSYHCVLVIDRSTLTGWSGSGSLPIKHVIGMRGQYRNNQQNDGFYYPYSCAVDEECLYVADYSNRRVQVYTKADWQYKHTIATNGNCYGIAVDEDRIYCALQSNNRVDVYKKEMGGGKVMTISGSGTRAMRQPYGVAVDDERVYVACYPNHQVLAFEKQSGDFFAAYGTGQANIAGWSYPVGVAVHDGKLYVANSGSQSVKVVDIESSEVLHTISGIQQAWGLCVSKDFRSSPTNTRKLVKHHRVMDPTKPVAFVRDPNGVTRIPPYLAAYGEYVTIKLLRPAGTADADADGKEVKTKGTNAPLDAVQSNVKRVEARLLDKERLKKLPLGRFDRWVSQNQMQAYNFLNEMVTVRKVQLQGSIYITRGKPILAHGTVRFAFRIDSYTNGDLDVGFMTRATANSWLRSQENIGVYGVTQNQVPGGLRGGTIIIVEIDTVKKTAEFKLNGKVLRAIPSVRNLVQNGRIYPAVAIRQIGGQVTLFGDIPDEEKQEVDKADDGLGFVRKDQTKVGGQRNIQVHYVGAQGTDCSLVTIDKADENYGDQSAMPVGYQGPPRINKISTRKNDHIVIRRKVEMKGADRTKQLSALQTAKKIQADEKLFQKAQRIVSSYKFYCKCTSEKLLSFAALPPLPKYIPVIRRALNAAAVVLEEIAEKSKKGLAASSTPSVLKVHPSVGAHAEFIKPLAKLMELALEEKSPLQDFVTSILRVWAGMMCHPDIAGSQLKEMQLLILRQGGALSLLPKALGHLELKNRSSMLFAAFSLIHELLRYNKYVPIEDLKSILSCIVARIRSKLKDPTIVFSAMRAIDAVTANCPCKFTDDDLVNLVDDIHKAHLNDPAIVPIVMKLKARISTNNSEANNDVIDLA